MMDDFKKNGTFSQIASELQRLQQLVGKLMVKRQGMGFPPQYTTAQRNALTSPYLGMIIYNTTTNTIQGYHALGVGWKDL